MSILIARLSDGYLVNQGGKSILINSTLTREVDSEKFGLQSSFTRIDGIIGTITLKYTKYLITIDESSVAGNINSNIIYQVTKFSILPIGVLTNNEEDKNYLSLLNQHLTNGTFFYSKNYDLTNSLQRQSKNFLNISNDKVELNKLDKRFWWNEYLSEELFNFPEFITPLIYGYVKIVQTSILSHKFSFGLITRRSKYRAGTRYFRRGIDENGNAANFNETEQILISNESGGNIFSYLQTRGSVPTYWAEINNLRYKPKLIVNETNSIQSTAKHFDEQVKLYGKNYLVNLVNQKGYEKPVKDSYERAVQLLARPDDIKYVYFDFHHECRNMKWYRVQLLIDQLVLLGYSNNNYFQSSSGKILNSQDAVVRTNCMDCLDRTNVVQSTLGLWVLNNQFGKLGINAIDDNFKFQFQNIWADNADYVSKAYSGTGALKTDFTRLGRRTKLGALNDLQNSLVRYLRNNYFDGLRQDGIDLFLGNFKPLDNNFNPFNMDKRSILIQYVPTIMWSSLGVLIFSLLFRKSKNYLLFHVFLFGVFLGSLNFVFKNNYYYVNWPKFVPVHTYVKAPLQTSKKD